MPSDISVEIDFDASGKQFGRVVFRLEAPWNDRREIVLPACVIANGEGPTVSLWGGNHGNEYEGPVVLNQLARELDPAAIQGRLIILPTINPPAIFARTRLSGADGKNMNRIWPGDPEGSISDRIVAWLDRNILPVTDVLMDQHTGGDNMDLILMSMCHHSDDEDMRARIRAAQLAYNAPMSVELKLGAGRATAAGRAHDRGILVVGSESGGGGSVTPATLDSCYHGIRNVLAHLEMLPAPPAPGRPRPVTRFTRKWGHEGELPADRDGMFIPFHNLWDEVEAGQPAGQIIAFDAPLAAPETVRFTASGIIAGRRARSGIETGDTLYWIVRDIDDG